MQTSGFGWTTGDAKPVDYPRLRVSAADQVVVLKTVQTRKGPADAIGNHVLQTSHVIVSQVRALPTCHDCGTQHRGECY